MSTVNCGTHLVDKTAFDPCETAGSYDLDLRDPYNRTVLLNLIRASLSGSGTFLPLKVAGRPTPFNATVKDMQVRISDNSSIDCDDWSVCTGGGVNLPIVEKTDREGQPVPILRVWARLLGRSEDSVSCSVRFTFKNQRKRAAAGDRLSDKNFEILRDSFSDPGATSEKCIETIDIIFGSDTAISMEQTRALLGVLNDGADPARAARLSAARVTFVARCFHKVVEAEKNSELVEGMTDAEEKRAVEKLLGNVSFQASPSKFPIPPPPTPLPPRLSSLSAPTNIAR